MALEVRYVGTRGHDSWRTNINGNNGANAGNGAGTLDVNEFNIFENRFIDEFRLAQAQPARQHRGHRHARRSPIPARPGTSPLPTFLGVLQRAERRPTPATRRSTPARTGRARRSSNFLAERNPNPFGFATAGTANTSGLMGNATLRANAAAAGIPGQLLRRQSRSARRRVPAHQHRRVEVQLDAGRAAPPLCRRPAVPDQLRLRQGLSDRLGDVARGSAVDSRRRHARRRDARHQGEHRL